MKNAPQAPSPRAIPPDAVLKLAGEVERRRLPNREYLTNRITGRTLQLGGAATAILDELDRGIRLPELIAALQQRFPDADVTMRTSSFVGRLADSGMLDGLAERRAPLPRRTYELRGAHRAFGWPAALLGVIPPPIRTGMTLLLAAAAATFVFYAIATGQLGSMWNLLSWRTAVVFLLIPFGTLLHEAGHGVMARLVHVSVSAAGIMRRSLLIAPYVRTGPDFLTAPRSAKVWICLAGPLIDWLEMGAIAALLALFPFGAEWRGAWAALFLVKALTFTGNLSLNKKSDGSDALCAWLGDYRLRKAVGAKGADAIALPGMPRYRRAILIFSSIAAIFWLAVGASLVMRTWSLYG